MFEYQQGLPRTVHSTSPPIESSSVSCQLAGTVTPDVALVVAVIIESEYVDAVQSKVSTVRQLIVPPERRSRLTVLTPSVMNTLVL